MKLEYKTDRLPLNFITLGYMLAAIGIWRIIVLDWRGVLFFLISILLIFFKSGIIIDTETRQLKRYNGIFFIKIGDWEDINQLISLQMVKSKETQTMSVLSISRTATNDSCELFLCMPDRNILLMKSSNNDVLIEAEKIASSLHTTLISNL